ACTGALRVVQWLLERGAKVNHYVNGIERCFPLSGAVTGGHLDVVKLLVEQGGAQINAVWAGQNALSFALIYRRKDIESYLRSKGATEPLQVAEPSKPRSAIL